MSKDKITLKFRPDFEKSIKRHRDRLIEERMDVVDFISRSRQDFMLNRAFARDLCDSMDGLNSVERRLIYTMFTQNLSPKTPRAKAATTIGRAIETVYPHGNGPIDSTHARLGGPTVMIQYVDGEGNFGDLEKPSGFAEMRYRQGRLSAYAWDCFFAETDKNNPNFDVKDNYDFSGTEPVWLPSKYPNILMQWNTGIAIGISANLAAFNSKEVMEAAIELIDDPMASIDIYPDFPTDCYITNKKEIKGCFDMNKFIIKVVSPYEISYKRTPQKEYTTWIVFKSLPYGTSVTSIVSAIKKIKSSEKGLKEVLDLKINVKNDTDDETMDSKSLEFMIQVDAGYDPKETAEKLIYYTQLGTSIPVNYNVTQDNAIVHSTPRQLMLYWINERMCQKYRRIQLDIANVANVITVTSALVMIHNHKDGIDRLIKIMRHHKVNGKAATEDQLIEEIVRVFGIRKKQAEVVSNMKIKSISSLSLKELEEKLVNAVATYDTLIELNNDESIKEMIKAELKDGIKKYSIPRKASFKDISTIHSQDLVLSYDSEGYYSMATNRCIKHDNKLTTIKFNTSDTLRFVYSDGTIELVDGANLKEVTDGKKAIYITEAAFRLKGLVSVFSEITGTLAVVTNKGFMKLVDAKEIKKKSSLPIIPLKEDDYVVAVLPIKNKEYLAVYDDEMIYYQSLDNIPVQKRGGSGVAVLKKWCEHFVGAKSIDKSSTVFITGSNGYSKAIDSKLLDAPSKKKPGTIAFQGKEIRNIYSLGDKENTYMFSGMKPSDIEISVTKSGISINLDGKVETYKFGNSKSKPIKMFKVGKNEHYVFIKK
jgi:DNA gyrase/topoisomerase IV subunit A